MPSTLGIWLDPRDITGGPAWLKPAKFALSTGVYSLTLAWVFTYLPEWRRTRRIVGRVTAAVMLLEVAIIDLQAWRRTTSHFNVAAPLDATLFGVMGLAIFLQTSASLAVATALWRQSFADRAIGWALRLGMAITIVGAFAGGLMTSPTEAQLAEARATQRLTLAGAHTVGAPDGGPGLPVTGWSTRHGDLRVPHFVGLHALQTLPIITVVFLRRRDEPLRTRLTLAAMAVYVVVFVALLIRACGVYRSWRSGSQRLSSPSQYPWLRLGAAERFVDDLFWSRWRFEISVFDLLGVRRGERIDETV